MNILAGYAAPSEHVFHLTLEATDFDALTRALAPLNHIGAGRTVPVIPLQDALTLGEAGAFRFE